MMLLLLLLVSAVAARNIDLGTIEGAKGFKLVSEGPFYSVNRAGDINGDGFDDILIANAGYNNGTGRVYVVFGGFEGINSTSDIMNPTLLNDTYGFKMDGETPNAYFGYSASGAGDINGDSFADIIIGSPKVNYSDAGRVYVIFGGVDVGSNGTINITSLNGSDGFVMIGEESNWTLQNSGFAVNGAGDMNGDGYDDIIIGGPWYKRRFDQPGHGYVVFGGVAVGGNGTLYLATLNGVNGFYLAEGTTSADIISGIAVSSAGDLNHDGYGDIIYGEEGCNYPSGCAYVIFGGSYLANGTTQQIYLPDPPYGFQIDSGIDFTPQAIGASVSGLGDINGDGIDDVIIGAPDSNRLSGCSYVVFGAEGLNFINKRLTISDFNGKNGFVITGQGHTGTSVSGGGDVNGDGYNDMLIGAPAEKSFVGRTYVVFGGPKVGNQGKINLASLHNGYALTGPYEGDPSGECTEASGEVVSILGDINGDAISDLAIGAPGICRVVYTDTYVVFGELSSSSRSFHLSWIIVGVVVMLSFLF
jgi:hypothetical protein